MLMTNLGCMLCVGACLHARCLSCLPFVRACMRACMHACMPSCLLACSQSFMRVVCIRAGLRACVLAFMRPCVHTFLHACVHACKRACVRACPLACMRGRLDSRSLSMHDVCVRACMRGCVHEPVVARVCACEHSYTHAFIRASVQARMRVCSHATVVPCIGVCAKTFPLRNMGSNLCANVSLHGSRLYAARLHVFAARTRACNAMSGAAATGQILSVDELGRTTLKRMNC